MTDTVRLPTAACTMNGCSNRAGFYVNAWESAICTSCSNGHGGSPILSLRDDETLPPGHGGRVLAELGPYQH